MPEQHSRKQNGAQADVNRSGRAQLSDEVIIAMIRREELLALVDIRMIEFALISYEKQLATLQSQLKQVSYLQ